MVSPILSKKKDFFPFPSPLVTEDIKIAYQKIKDIEDLLNHKMLPRPSEMKIPIQYTNIPIHTIEDTNGTIHTIHSPSCSYNKILKPFIIAIFPNKSLFMTKTKSYK